MQEPATATQGVVTIRTQGEEVPADTSLLTQLLALQQVYTHILTMPAPATVQLHVP